MVVTPREEDYNLLNTSAIIEIYKKRLNEIESNEQLSKKERHHLSKLRRMLDRAGELRVQEPKLLMKIFDVYSPKTTLFDD